MFIRFFYLVSIHTPQSHGVPYLGLPSLPLPVSAEEKDKGQRQCGKFWNIEKLSKVMVI